MSGPLVDSIIGHGFIIGEVPKVISV